MKNKNKNSDYSFASRLISGILIPVILGVQIFSAPISQAQPTGTNEPKKVTALIAVLVEDSLLENNSNYPGIGPSYPNDLTVTTLRDRISRYARDAQLSQPYTKAVIIRVKKTDSPVQISQALETLYYKGESTDTVKSQLDGVVIIGDVALPVVNKNGNRFVSMFPYTDFEDKAYIYNSAINEFEKNPDVLSPKVEVWHGVIKPSKDGEDGNSQLAYFFDKNHLFHIGNTDFTQFNRKMLFADIFWEQESMDKTALSRYEKYVKHMADFAYLRFTKTLLKELAGVKNPALGDGIDNDLDGLIDEDLQDGIDNDGDGLIDEDNIADNDSDGLIDEDPADEIDNDLDGRIDEDGPENPEAIDTTLFDSLPDVQSRSIIFSYALKYNEVVKNYLQKANDYVKGLGRYDEYDSVAGLIVAKDLYTQQFLKQVNDALEKKVDDVVPLQAGPVALIDDSTLTGVITFEDNTTANITSWDFTNYVKHQYNDPIVGPRDITYYNGLPSVKVDQAWKCSVYHGGNSTVDDTAQLIEGNLVYRMETTQSSFNNDGYDGCYGINIEHPERCFKDEATKWVYDPPDGTKAVTNIPDSAVSYGGCFDFREKSRLSQYLTEVANYIAALAAAATEEQKAALTLPGDKHRPTENILLYQQAIPQLSITFKDILDLYGGFDGKDNNSNGTIDESGEYNLSYKIAKDDWYTIGREILGSRKTHFIIKNPPFQGIKEIDLDIAQTKSTIINPPDALHPVPWPSNIEAASVTYHKEPTLDTIKRQMENQNTDALPANNPRYLAFQDKNGNFQKFDYPDAFKAEDGEGFKKTLKDLETRVKNLPGFNPALTPVDEKFQEIIAAPTETTYADPNQNILLKTTLDQVDEAIKWRNMSIDEKHAWAIREYIDKDTNAYLGESENGYEYMYLTAEGSYDEIKFETNRDPVVAEQDATFINPESTLDPAAEEAPEENDENQSVFILEWFKYIVEYLVEVADSTTKGIEFKQACGSEEENVIVDELPAEEPDGGAALLEDANLIFDSNENGVPDSADATKKLKIDLNDGMTQVPLDSRESYPVNIKALDASGQTVGTDSFTEVKLEIIQTTEEKSAKIYGEDIIRLVNGEGIVKIIPTGIPGNFSLMAHTLNRPAKIISDALNITSEGRKVKVMTYTMEVQEAPTFTQEVLKDYTVKDDAGNEIAIINADTGKIQIKDPKYEVTVFESTNILPMRIAVTEIQTGNIIASIVIVPKKEVTPEIHETDYSIEDNILTLNGVHVTDVNKDDFIHAYIDQTNVYVVDDHGLYSKRIAKLTAQGKVYTADGYFIKVKNQDAFDKQYIFEIVDSSNSKIIEFAIGYLEGSITINKEENEFAELNVISAIFKMFAEKYARKAYAQTKQIIDTDRDGLTDIEELTIGTDRLVKDSDGDGYTDSEEITSGYDPLKKNVLLFSDLPPSNAAYKAFTKLLLLGIVKKTPDNKIRPDDLITREEYVQMVLGLSCTNCSLFSDKTKQEVNAIYLLNPFPDNDIQNEFKYCVAEGKNRGIVSGYAAGLDKGYFKPNYNINRAEAIKVILEAAGIDTSKYNISGQPWYYKYVLTAQDLNILPKQVRDDWLLSAVSRAEFATMENKVMENVNCYLNDDDSDGLPNNIEIYQYNTDPNKADTDGGGKNDLEEIVGGKDPLNPDDDMKADTDGDGMQDAWEEQYKFDIYNPKDASFDSDNDGLTNLQEYENNTDPRNPDTDGGGKDDGDEVLLQDTDPLNKDDDGNGVELETGIFAVGNNVSADIVYKQVSEGEATESPLYIDNLPADNESTLYLTAQILDENGDIIIEDSSSIIEFFIKDNSETDVEILQPKVKVSNGVAVTQIKSKTKAGICNIDAKIIGKELPSVIRTVNVEPLSPYEIEIIPESSVIKTGGLSKTPLKITLLDENGNTVNNDFYEITVTPDGPGKIDPKADTRSEKEGVQIESYEGVFNVDLYSTAEEGDIEVKATLEIAEPQSLISSTSTVSSTNDISIKITPDKETLTANGQDIVKLQAEAVDSLGYPLIGFNQQITFKSSNNNYGEFLEEPIKNLIDGKADISFKSSIALGPLEITAAVAGLDAGSISIPLIADVPYEIKLKSSTNKINSEANATIEAQLYDKFGNPVMYLDNIEITFKVTDATKIYAEIDSSAVVMTSKGLAKAEIKAKTKSGPVNIVATANGLKSGTMTIQVIKKIKGEELAGTYPNVLYASLIGAGFGDITQKDYLGGSLLFNGKTQAVTALTTQAKAYKPLVNINNNGSIKVLDDAQARASFVPANSNSLPNRVQIESPDTSEALAEVYYIFPQDAEIVLEESTYSEILKEAIFVKKVTTDEAYNFIKTENNLAITYNGQEAIKITNTGYVRVNDNFFNVTLSDAASPFLALSVIKGEENIADIIFAINSKKNVFIQDANFEYQAGYPYEPGVYIKPLSRLSNYKIEQAFSQISTNLPKGAKVINTDLTIPDDQGPGFSYTSLEKVFNEQGIGFDGDNKHALFFAAGHTVGNANKPYASEIGINLGDPTIRIRNEALAGGSGYTEDIGTPLYYGDEQIKELMLADYNNDTLPDILLAYEDGKIKLIQNQLSAQQFKDKGDILDIKNGIYSADAADFNNDGFADLLISTKESCLGKEVCIYIYENQGGKFVRKNLNLDVEDKIAEIRVADLNNDNFTDIILTDFSGNVRIYYNNFGEIETKAQILENLGIRIDATKDLKEDVLIHYTGMPVEIPDDPTIPTTYDDDLNFESMSLETKTASQNEFIPADEQAKLLELGAVSKDFITSEDVMFIYMDKDPIFGTVQSKKQATDINGGTLSLDDKIVYTLTFTNTSTTDINNIMASDMVPDSLELDPETVKCLNCEEGEYIELIETGQSLRPYVIGNIDIPTGESRIITYETNIRTIPKIKIDLNKNFDAPFTKDEFIDISVNPEGNSSGKIVFMYSVSKNPETGKMTYARYVSQAETSDPAEKPYDETLDANGDGVPDQIQDIVSEQNTNDDDADGIPNSWDEVNGKINEVLTAAEAIISKLSCGAGCMPTPINMAFLVPGQFNIMGIPVPFPDPGLPVFGWGAPSPIPVWPPTPYATTTGGRLYLSPTLTGGLATAVCLGPYMGAQCWAFPLPISLIPESVCDAITEGLASAMAKVTDFMSSVNSTTTVLSGGGSGGGAGGSSLTGRTGSGGITGSSVLGGYSVSGSGKTNSTVPGFPGVITSWFARQMNEIIGKLSDLPDLYVYYPDINSIVNKTPPKAKFKNFTDVLTYINKLPLIQLESRSIVLKIPAITQREIVKLQSEFTIWITNAKLSLEQYKNKFNCKSTAAPKVICTNYVKKIEKAVMAVEKNLQILDEYKNLPRQILEYRTIQTKYIKQIICYLDTILAFAGGYFKRQQARIKGWIDFIVQLKQTIKTWKAISNIMVEYTKSCDACKTERWTLMEMMMKVLVFIPEIPIIPFPKWPDIYFDFSQIQLGLKIIWPDIRFKAEPLTLPSLPTLQFPDINMDTSAIDQLLDVQFPEVPTIPALPQLIKFPDLPDLPPLPIPTLPDIPKPPRIPSLSPSLNVTLGALSKILKLMCLIKKSMIPVLETNLKTQIESLTARPLSAVLPIDTLFKFQTPAISYPFVDNIKITTKMDFRIETDAIYNAVNELAMEWNSIITDVAEASNQAVTQTQNITTPLSSSIPEKIVLKATQNYININADKSLDEIKTEINNENLPEEFKDNYLVQVRNGLIAYADDINKIDTSDFTLLGDYPILNKYVDTRMVASLNPIDIEPKTDISKEQDQLSEVEELGKNINKEFENRLIALSTDAVSSNVVDANEAMNPTSGQQIQGLFVYNKDEGINESVLAYLGEIDLENHILIADIDDDTDEDIIYSYGGNAYLKENYKKPKSSKYLNYLSTEPQVYNLSEFVPLSPSISGFSANYDSGKSVDFSWNPADAGKYSGYEIVYKDSRDSFDINTETPSNKINIFERISQYLTIGKIKEDLEMTVVNGSYTVNGEETTIFTFGDTIETSEDSNTEIVITFSDSSQIVLGPSSSITLPDYVPGNFQTTILTGNALFKSNYFTNLFLQEGGSVITENGLATLEYKNGDAVVVNPVSIFFGSNSEKGYAFVESIDGQASIKSMPRTILTAASEITEINKDILLHTMEDSTFELTLSDGTKQIFSLSANINLPISQGYAENLKLKINSGKAEAINLHNNSTVDLQLEKGMLVQFGDKITMNSGTGLIRFTNGAKTNLIAGDTLLLQEMTTPDSPFSSLETIEGNYYGTIYTYDQNGFRSNPSDIKLFAPQLCSDKEAPFAEAGPSKKDVIIMQKLKIDASKSFDTSGQIVGYYLDTNLDEDTDSDGDPENDKDMISQDPENPVFTLGPFNELKTSKAVLNVQDESLNTGKQIIEINVIVPDITLDDASARESTITGSINPIAEEIPINLIRNRKGLFKNLANTTTNIDGEFTVTDLNYEDMIIVKNAQGEIVAEIDPKTGRVVIVDNNYYTDVLEAIPPNLPTRVVIKEKQTELILATILMIPDMNTDVSIDTGTTTFTKENVIDLEGVNIIDRNDSDNFNIRILPADDPNFTGAAEIQNSEDNSRIAIIDSGGSVYFFNEKLDLQLKSALTPDEPIIIELLYQGEVIAELYIAINNGRPVEISNRENIKLPPENIAEADSDGDGMSDKFEYKYGLDANNPQDANLDADGDGLSNLEEFRLKTNPFNKDTDGDGFSDGEEVAFGKDPLTKASSPFTDVSPENPYYNSIVNLSQKNILRGEVIDGKLYFKPNEPITRKDFADIILKMLCIVPRPEAYREPSLLSDILYSKEKLDYYYAVIKEAVLQGFITGYTGEKDPISGLSPFKPDNSITKAEAIKIILEALEKQKIITLAEIQPIEGTAWYKPYIDISKDLKPYLLQETEVKETYILTEEEAKNPETEITRAEFVAIADRVLKAFDCYAIDDDKDGMPSVWELEHGLNPFDPSDAAEDADNEGLINLDEYRHGTDPHNNDTDSGGATDKEEVDNGTNPVNFPEDDNLGIAELGAPQEDLRKGLEEGVYVVEDTCNACPCKSALDHSADLIPGDIIFGVISTENQETIFAKSNEITFKGLLNQ